MPKKFSYNHASHCKYAIKLHFVFCIKYRRRILIGGFAEKGKQLIVAHTTKSGFGIDAVEVDTDHIHILVDMPPTKSALDFVRLTKMTSTYHIWRSEYSHFLGTIFWREKTLWSDGYFVASTGQASTDTIKKYIESQG